MGMTGFQDTDGESIDLQDLVKGIVTTSVKKSGKTAAPGWADGSGYRVGKEGTDYAEVPQVESYTIKAGAGFWFQNPGADCTITFTK